MNSDRIQEIQETTPYPQSHSVAQALKQVWNECQQDFVDGYTKIHDLTRELGKENYDLGTALDTSTSELSLAKARIDVLEGENAKLVTDAKLAKAIRMCAADIEKRLEVDRQQCIEKCEFLLPHLMRSTP